MTVRATMMGTVIAFVVFASAAADEKPNIIFIMADDLGYGHLGCYGQERIETPNIDRLAAEGMRFTHCYAGATVCAPTRSVLMTGLHGGHTAVRGNLGGQYLYDEDVTVAEVLKPGGYATGGFGKWGLGQEGSEGHPLEQGFDEFFGYLGQVHAHFYYPYYLVDNHGKHLLAGNKGGKRGTYSHDVIVDRAMQFIRRNRNEPFFCYLPVTIPHTEVTVPEDSMKPYRGRWPEGAVSPEKRKGYIVAKEPKATWAGMISRLDRDVGRIVALVKELRLEKQTLIMFTSDNGAHAGYGTNLEFFKGNGDLRGTKGTMYEGGLRVPLIAFWPGRIKPGSEADHFTHFAYMMPTFAELAGVAPPVGTDGISIVPTLLGRGAQAKHHLLYWELVRNDAAVFRRGARMGDWKVVQNVIRQPPELYNLKDDPGEKSNVASKHAEIVQQIEARMKAARTPARAYERGYRPGAADYVR